MESIDRRLHNRVARFCSARHLPDAYAVAARTQLWPLAQWLVRQRHGHGGGLVVGINGAQGTGKSTLCALLGELLELADLRAVVVSIDDLYLTHAQRLHLAHTVHPLLATRGVPGTHDVGMGIALLDRLCRLGSDETLELPRFDKATDDRRDPSLAARVSGPVDIVLFEGWCVGTPPQCADALRRPINALEADDDADARWRIWVNQQLGTTYAPLFARIDRLVFLRAPDFAQVHAWRARQEADTARAAGAATALLDPTVLRRFIEHYERLTRHALEVLPDLADVVVDLGADHAIGRVRYRDGGNGPGQPAAPSR